MKKILFLLLLVAPVGVMAQMIPFEMGAIKVDSIYLNESSDWFDELNTSTVLSGATDKQVPSALSVKTFVIDTVPKIIHDSIVGIDFSATSLQDSIDKHTDTLQLHNNRVKALELTDHADHAHMNKAILDATTASFTTALSSTISGHTTSINKLNDSVAVHTDTLQLHDTRLKSLEDDIAQWDSVVQTEFYFEDTVHFTYFDLDVGDTTAVIVIGDGEYADSASLVPAAKAWTDKLESFETFYAKSEELKALPLPYPNGKDRRRPNAKFVFYQFEYELERNVRYDKELRDRVIDLEKENERLKKKPNRAVIKELLYRVDSLERRVDELEKIVCK